MKHIPQILFLFFSLSLFAQADFTNRWEDFFSYNNVKDFVKTDSQIIALANNAVFIYDISSEEIKKISTVNGLSGETTSSLYFSESQNKIVVGYTNGLIEIIDEDLNINVAKDIVNFNFSGDKSINHISEFENKLYLSTSFAIVVYDLERLEFGDTYFIGNQSSELHVNETVIFNNTIYAATEEGVYLADLSNQNLIDFKNWTKYFTGNFSGIASFNSEVFVAQDRNLYKFNDTNLLLQKSYPLTIVKLKPSTENLSIATSRRFFVNNIEGVEIFNYTSQTTDDLYFNLNVCYTEKNTVYLGTKEFGILTADIENIPNFKSILPEGPSSNSPFSISAKNNHLWVTFGGQSTSYAPLGRRYGVSHFNGDNWIDIPHESINMRDLVHVNFDPNNDEKVYISSWGGGMTIVENDIVSTQWNHTNSGLESLILTSNPNYKSVRISSSAFDDFGNLWIANAWVDDRVKKYNADGTWSSFDMSSVMTNPALGLNELAIDKSNTICIGSRRNGLLLFNESGNRKRALTTELNNGSLPNLNVRTIQADANDRFWIGTLNGLVVLYNASAVFDQSNVNAEPIIILDNGIPERLLGEQPINSIAIDGSDRKWIGTSLSGVVLTNSAGTEVLQTFNKDNSPLPSNNILKIVVDQSTGKTYFATDKGIVAYNSDVAKYGESLPEVYAYPNPAKKQHEFVTIDGRNGEHLPENSNIKILDTAGNLVFETNLTEAQNEFGGKVVWDKTNLAGRKVASGVYIVLITANEHSETTVTKIAIIN